MQGENKIISLNQLFNQYNLNIPNYQRPYKWGEIQVIELLQDINYAIKKHKENQAFRYRLGSIILHKDNSKSPDGNDIYNIVDGQQRLITLALIMFAMDKKNCPFIDNKFDNPISQINIKHNYEIINNWCSSLADNTLFEQFVLKENGKECSYENKIFEVVVLVVGSEQEAFQLFDSQNSRGKALYPHDLLKAYHLRAMNDQRKNERNSIVTRWENRQSKEISQLFNDYLYPIKCWASKRKCYGFAVKDIDEYKGAMRDSNYTYTEILNKSLPCFQITDSILTGKSFFDMVDYYLLKLDTIYEIIKTDFVDIHNALQKGKTVGFSYAKNLFYCAVLCYYDRFANADKQVINMLFLWAMSIRVDMDHLGKDTITKYAIGEENGSYSNSIAMFEKITNARTHQQLQFIDIKLKSETNNDERKSLYEVLEKIKKVK